MIIHKEGWVRFDGFYLRTAMQGNWDLSCDTKLNFFLKPTMLRERFMCNIFAYYTLCGVNVCDGTFIGGNECEWKIRITHHTHLSRHF